MISDQGNGICTDSCNDSKHKYDLGDCCLEQISDHDCLDCICNQDDLVHPKSECPHHLIGDGHCHDECNRSEFSYDSNDCCLSIIIDAYCTDCTCHLDNLHHTVPCDKYTSVGDGYCDDNCNIKAYNFDNDDCCSTTPSSRLECTQCICHGVMISANPCLWSWLHDQFCDDECNTADYNYDGGDCCYDRIDQSYCHQCICHLDGQVHPPGTPNHFIDKT